MLLQCLISIRIFLKAPDAKKEVEIREVGCSVSIIYMYARGQGVRTPLNIHKNIVFLSKTGPHSLEKKSAFNVGPSSAHQRNAIKAIIGPPAKRHFNGVLLVGR